MKERFFILMGVNDSFFLGEGWHACTVDERYGLHYRPTMRSARIELPAGTAPRKVSILMTSSPPMLGKPVEGEIFFDGQPVHSFKIKSDLWRFRHIQLPHSVSGDQPHSLEFKINETFVPDRYLNNGDHREMGLYVSSLRFF